MDEATKRIAEGLLKAIQLEVDGQHFYRMAAKSTADPRGREVFERLAREEEEHQRFLKTQYKSVSETGAPSKEVRLGSPADLSGTSPVFSDQIQTRLREAHYEMSALSIGIQLELSAIKFYRAEAAAVTDPTVRSFYTELAEWESGHYNALLRQQEMLKEDYWHAGGFYPF
ncbi:MAG: ferritin family protein [Candidatus Zixiibacteriota bacterium]